MLAAYVDLHKAFDSMNLDALSKVLVLRGVLPKLINLISELYSGTDVCSGTGTILYTLEVL